MQLSISIFGVRVHIHLLKSFSLKHCDVIAATFSPNRYSFESEKELFEKEINSKKNIFFILFVAVFYSNMN